MVEVPLAVLRDAVTTASGALRCAVRRTSNGGTSTFTDDDGRRVPYSRILVCRAGSAPAVLSALTVRGVACVVGAVRVEDTPGPWMRHAAVYCTTRADVTGGDLPDQVTVYPSEQIVDAYGTPLRRPSAVGVAVQARLDPVSARESESDGQRRTDMWTLVADGDLSLLGADAYSTLVDDEGRTFALDGDPIVREDTVGGCWSTAALRWTGRLDGS